jgi:hypothetical protein
MIVEHIGPTLAGAGRSRALRTALRVRAGSRGSRHDARCASA